METRTDGPSFKGQFIPPPDPPSQSTDRLSDQALMALPFIGMFVGVDELVPTKAIYAVYDPSNCGITYVRGDGTFAVARHICFTRQFKDPSIPLYRSQRTHLLELMSKSALHYHRTNSRDVYPANILVKFPTQSSVKASLTYIGDLVLGSCPALTNFDATPKGPDLSPPHIILKDKHLWDFNTAGFQAVAAPNDDIIDTKYNEFKQQYPTVRINSVDFQHAAFCLAGMLKQGLISFLYEGQNDRRYFVKGQTPVKHPKLVDPLRTARGWTVDCFLARFEKFQDVYTKKTYAQIPNPINWLEAEMETEARLGRKRVPWSIEPEKRDNSVVSWELLKIMPFKTRGDSKEYPKSLIPKAPRPLRLDDIVSKSGKLRESKYAKKERKEREKADKEAGRGNYAPVDLTDEGGFVPGHMGSNPSPFRGRERANYNHGARGCRGFYTVDFENMLSATGQKRKHINVQGSFQNPTFIYDSDEPEEIQPRPVKRSPNVQSDQVEIKDIYNDSGSERHRKKKSRRKSQSRRGKSLVPGASSLFASPGRTLRDREELATRLGSAANSQQETPQSFRSGSSAPRTLQWSQADIPESESEHETQVAEKQKNSARGSERGSITSDRRMTLGSPFASSSSEPRPKDNSNFDYSDDEGSDDGYSGPPQVNNHGHAATSRHEGRSPTSAREAATKLADKYFNRVDRDNVPSTSTGASTVNNASDAENIPLSSSRQPTASPETDKASSHQSSPHSSQKTPSTSKIVSSPHTPSPQTGDRFYDHIDGQVNADTSPEMTPLRKPRKSPMNRDRFRDFAPKKAASPKVAIKDEEWETSLGQQVYFDAEEPEPEPSIGQQLFFDNQDENEEGLDESFGQDVDFQMDGLQFPPSPEVATKDEESEIPLANGEEACRRLQRATGGGQDTAMARQDHDDDEDWYP